MAHYLRDVLIAFFILMLGGVLPMIAPSLDPAPIAQAAETQCTGRAETVQRGLDQLTAQLTILERKIQPGSSDSIDIGDPQIDQYMDILGSSRQKLQGTDRSLVQFSQNKCGKSQFEGFRTIFIQKVEQFNRHISFAHRTAQERDWQPEISIRIPELYRIGNLDYASDTTDCRLLILATKNTVETAKRNMDAGEQDVANWLSTQQNIDSAKNSYNAADQGHKAAQAALRQAQAKGCHTNTETKAEYDRLKGETDQLARRKMELETSIGSKAQEWQNIAHATAAGVASDFDSCKCHDIKILTTDGGGPLAASVQKALCYVICGISVAIGRFACLIVGSIIDPMMNSGQPTCTPKNDAGSSSGGGSSASPGAGGSSPGGGGSSPGGGGDGTIPGPTGTPEDGDDETAPDDVDTDPVALRLISPNPLIS